MEVQREYGREVSGVRRGDQCTREVWELTVFWKENFEMQRTRNSSGMRNSLMRVVEGGWSPELSAFCWLQWIWARSLRTCVTSQRTKPTPQKHDRSVVCPMPLPANI